MSSSNASSCVSRPERHDDRGQIREVGSAAFGSTFEADLVERIGSSPEFVPDMALVAEVADDPAARIIGHVMISGAVAVETKPDSGGRRT